MVYVKVFALILCIGVVSTTPATRIVGGEPTTIDRYPSLVQVDYLNVYTFTWSHSCAASIITQRHLLSAAHCFTGPYYNPSFRRIRAGTTLRNSGGIIRQVAGRINHPTFGWNYANGDIAVVLLAADLVYSPVIQPVAIISNGFELPDNLPVVHAGWGATNPDGTVASSELLDVTVYTINRDLCRERYTEVNNMFVTDNMICAGILDVGGKDACNGDSGGPMYYGDLLVGIVSWGVDCGHERYPGVSTKISSYTDWVIMTAV